MQLEQPNKCDRAGCAAEFSQAPFLDLMPAGSALRVTACLCPPCLAQLEQHGDFLDRLKERAIAIAEAEACKLRAGGGWVSPDHWKERLGEVRAAVAVLMAKEHDLAVWLRHWLAGPDLSAERQEAGVPADDCPETPRA